MRLARFNVLPDSKVFFGLASPAAAGTMATMVWTWVDNLGAMESTQISILVAIIATLVALLMVSNVRYYSPKNIKGRVPFIYMLGTVLLFVVVAIYPPGMLLCVGLVYACSGPWQSLLRLVRSEEKNEAL